MISRRSILSILPCFLFAPGIGIAPLTEPGVSFSAILDDGKPVLAFVRADSCSSCRLQDQLLNTILDDSSFREVVFVHINFLADAEFRQNHDVNQSSTLILFRNGKEVARSIKAVEPSAIRQMLLC